MSEDALDRPRPRQKWGNKEKRAYAKEKALEDLLLPPKHPPPAWMSDTRLLPRRPPGKEKRTKKGVIIRSR